MEWGNVFAAGAQVSIISDLLRIISFGLDASLYGLAALTFNLIYKLYDFNSFIDTSTILSTMQKSVYSLLAIFMFFKLGFSLLGMLVNPDMVENKDKGAGKLVSGVAVCLVLIALMPTVFEYAMMVQTKVMEGQLIEKAMYGDNFASGNTRELGESKNFTLGSRLALSTWKVFMQPTVEKGQAVTAYDAVFEEIESRDGLWYNADLFSRLNDTTALGFFARIPGIALVANLFGAGVRYQLSYMIIVSTAASIFLLWTLLKLSIDVAYRSIKMFALQMLAPIAIITYIDPKSSKDGVFAKWVKEAVKTYTSLFVRVFVFAFVSVLLMELDYTKLNGGPMVMLMYILAIIAFIKAAPKFIDNILGTDISKDQDTKIAGDILKSLGTAGAGAAIGAVSARAKGYNPVRGAWEGMKNGFSSGMKAAKSNDFGGMMKAANGDAAMRKYYGLPTGADARKKAYENKVADDTFKAFKGRKTAFSRGNYDKIDDEADFIEELRKQDPAALTAYNGLTGSFEDKKKRIIQDMFLDKIGTAERTRLRSRGFGKMSDGNQRQFRSSYGNIRAIQSDSILGGHEIGNRMIEEEKMKQELIFAQDAEEAAMKKVELAQVAYQQDPTRRAELEAAQAERTTARDSVKNFTSKLEDAKKATAKAVEDPGNARVAKYYNDYSRGKERDG